MRARSLACWCSSSGAVIPKARAVDAKIRASPRRRRAELQSVVRRHATTVSVVSASPTLPVRVVDITDPDDERVDDFRDLNSVDRRPDLPVLPGGRVGKGLVIAEGVLVVQRMVASRFIPHAFLGVDRRLGELGTTLLPVDDPDAGQDSACSLRLPAPVPFYRATAEVMAQVVGFHLNRGVLGVARRPAELTVEQAVEGASVLAVLEGVNDHENIGSIFRNAAGLGVDAVLFGSVRRSAVPAVCPRVDGPRAARAVREAAGLAGRTRPAGTAGVHDGVVDAGSGGAAVGRRRGVCVAGRLPGRRGGAGAQCCGDARQPRAGPYPDEPGY